MIDKQFIRALPLDEAFYNLLDQREFGVLVQNLIVDLDTMMEDRPMGQVFASMLIYLMGQCDAHRNPNLNSELAKLLRDHAAILEQRA